jgi:hypothetical protein
VRLQLAVSRFLCPQSDCPRRIFAERLPGFAAPWARTTDRLRQTQTDIGSSLGGEAGARLDARMTITTNPETLLRRVKRLRNEPAKPPRVVGIDDWAWRKGQTYGTLVVDPERSEVIDVLPARDAGTVAAWLRAHPGVEVVVRDRSAAYAQAATEGASQAQQVADRWHLLKNSREAVERVLERHSAVVDAALKTTEPPQSRPTKRRSPRPPRDQRTKRRSPDGAVPETTGAAPSPVESPSPLPPSGPLPESPRPQAEPSNRHERIDRWLMLGNWWELGRDPHQAGGTRLASSRRAESYGGVPLPPAGATLDRNTNCPT